MSTQNPDDNRTVVMVPPGQAAPPAAPPPAAPPPAPPPPAGKGSRTPLLVGGLAGCLVIVLLLACGGAAWYFLAGPGKTGLLPTPPVAALTLTRPATLPAATATAGPTATTAAAATVTTAPVATAPAATTEAPTAEAATTVAPAAETATSAPQAALLAFASDRSGNYDIYVADLNSPDSPKNLTADNTGVDRDPAWSPDGKLIAFASDRDATIQIYVMHADGTSVTQLTHDKGPNTLPSWSRDGTKIAYASSLPGNLDVYVMNADGSSPLQVTLDGNVDFGARWSPDGKQIVYVTGRDRQSLKGTGEPYLKLSTAPGGAIRLLPNVQNAQSVDWSSDGKLIIFAGKPDPSGSFQIFSLQIDGRSLSKLSIVAANETFPSFSADGKQIVFSSDRGGNNNLFIMDADGSGQKQLTNASGDNIEGAWQPVP
jgi:Tol biopolymer transport system component